MIYQWKDKVRLTADPQEVGERLELLQAIHGRHLAPADLVQDGRDESSPLNTCFEWDDTAAAAAHRLQQARYLMRHLVVVMAEPGHPKRKVRAYVSVTPKPEEKPRYTDIHHAISDPELKRQLLAQALQELKQLRQRYADLHELGGIFAVIDQYQWEKSHVKVVGREREVQDQSWMH